MTTTLHHIVPPYGRNIDAKVLFIVCGLTGEKYSIRTVHRSSNKIELRKFVKHDVEVSFNVLMEHTCIIGMGDKRT